MQKRGVEPLSPLQPLGGRARLPPSRPRKKTGGVSPRRLLPLLMLVAFGVYGMWFTRAAQATQDAPPAAAEPAAAPVDAPPAAAAATSAVAIAAATAAPATAAAAAAAAASQQPPTPTHAEERAAALAALADGRCDRSVASPHFSPANPGGSAAVGNASRVAHFSGEQYFDVRAEGGGGFERVAMSVTAWVRPAGPEGVGESASIQTVASSKSSGCESSAQHHGFAVFVNEWNTNSEQLYASWGNGASGCEELATSNGAVKAGVWTHVAAVFDESAVRLYVNGKLSADSATAGGYRRIVGGRSPVERPLSSHSVRVGMHPDGLHGLVGQLDEVAVWPVALTAADVEHVMCGRLAALADASALAPSFRFSFEDGGSGGGGSGGCCALAPPVGGEAPPRAVVVMPPREKEFATPRTLSLAQTADAAAAKAARASGRAQSLANLERISGIGANDGMAGDDPQQDWPLPWLKVSGRPRPDAATINASNALAYERREHVRNVMKRAWSAYRRYSWGMDELKPVSNKSHNWLGLGATLVDCLDNLWIMGMKDEFYEARDWVAQHLHFDRASGISMFETVIRILGGLLSAFELSKEKIFLSKAQELADKLMYSFDRNPTTGLPCTTVSLTSSRTCTYPSWAQSAAILAEYGTMQLEFKYLSHHTGERKYWDAVEKPIRLLQRTSHPHHLYPTFINPKTGRWSSNKITFGALGDSFYEYLIKQWLLTGKQEEWLRTMYDETMVGMAKLLVQRSKPSGYVYVADWSGSSLQHKMDHLACFIAATLAIGAQDGRRFDAEYMALAEGIGETCYQMYARMKTGLAPEFVQFTSRDLEAGRSAVFNIGRPETVESLFVLWYYTQDPRWREMGWNIFTAFETYAATGSGWTALPDVNNPGRKRDDKMESFVLAETLKYIYLLFDPDYPIPLEKYVMNTEAHPLGHIPLPPWAEGGGTAAAS